MLFGARVAVADSVQYQSYGRSSQSEACVAQPGETPWQASWGTDSSWKPSWEQWANGGKGGWTCGRSITWAKTPVAGGSSSCATGGPCVLGDIGPGGGLVFLISGGLRYEMAPKTWGVNETTGIAWCSNASSDITGANGLAVGNGSANTTAMQPTACTSGAAVSARAYRGGGFSDWFLPSQGELNAMCNYSRNPTAPAAPSVNCFPMTQDGTFAGSAYGFASANYWSSSQFALPPTTSAWPQHFFDGDQSTFSKGTALRVRPVRAF